MISFKKGNILDDPSDALVVPVNLMGIAGAGLALGFKRRYPEWFLVYKNACGIKSKNPLVIGIPRFEYFDNYNKYIVDFPTKMHYAHSSRFGWVSVGLKNLRVQLLKRQQISSIAIPALGCGLGNLDWKDVKPEMIKNLNDINKEIIIYEPSQ